MELQVKQADFSENGLSPELVSLSVDKVYENVLCNFNTEGTAMVLNGFNTKFIKIPNGIDKFYFSGMVKRAFGLSLVKNVTLNENSLPTYFTVTVNGGRFLLLPDGSDTEKTFNEEEVDLSAYPDAEYFMYSMEVSQNHFADAHIDYLF